MLVKAGEENAGIVDIGDGLGCAFKIESHNHPSAIEPYQGAATGVGGINRDIFTMGARPIAQLNSLRFGKLDNPKTKWLVNGVTKGIGDYGTKQNWKDAIITAKETDTLFLNRHGPGPALRALRTERTTKLDLEPSDNIMGEMRGVLDLYFGGDMEAAIALSGQVAGRIDEVKPAKQIIDEVIADFHDIMGQMAKAYL